jgi:hypothetical protein
VAEWVRFAAEAEVHERVATAIGEDIERFRPT